MSDIKRRLSTACLQIGKYCPVELDIEAEAAKSPNKPSPKKAPKTQPSKLDPITQVGHAISDSCELLKP